MIRTKTWLLTLLLGASGTCGAQQLVNATGNTISGGGLTLEYSVGEIAVVTLTSASNDLTQGLLQPTMKGELPVGCPEMIDVRLYPNPTRGKSRVLGNQRWISGYMVYAADGKLVGVRPFYTNTVDMTPYAAGVYFIKFTPDCNGRYTTLKLAKQ